MRAYTVRDISNRLGVNQETVRRWVRSGELRSTIRSKKEGNAIEEHELERFLDKHPKYANKMDCSSTIDEALERTMNKIRRELNTLYARRDSINAEITRLENLLKRYEA